jgi:hypothetical protein
VTQELSWPLFGVVVSGLGLNLCWVACCLFVDFCLCWLAGSLKCLMSFVLVKGSGIDIVNGENASYVRLGLCGLVCVLS